MFGAAYRSLTNIAESVEKLTLAANISSGVIVDVANDWKSDKDFEREALAKSRKAALNKAIAAKKQQLESK